MIYLARDHSRSREDGGHNETLIQSLASFLLAYRCSMMSGYIAKRMELT
jgi:hypothetical protein